jgi:hypothetical protein
MKRIISILLLSTILFNCTNDTSNIYNPKSKLFGIKRVFDGETSYRIVELNINNGEIMSTILSRPYMQSSLHYELSFLKNTDELLVRQSVFQDNRGDELLKVNIQTLNTEIIPCDYFRNMISTPNGRLFGLKYTSDSKDLVEINPINGKIISILKSFKNLENAPQNNKTGVEYIFYSDYSKEIFIPRRLEFYSNSINDLIKINIETNKVTTLKTKNYEKIISGKNARLFAVKYEDKSYVLIEIDKVTGDEKKVIGTFENSLSDENMIYLSETNEIIEYSGYQIIKINIDTGERKNIQVDNDLVSISGFN